MTKSNGICLVLALLCGAAVFGQTQSKGEKVEQQKAIYRTGSVRYQVKDVARSVAFYTQNFGFKEGPIKGAPFASVSSGPLTIWLSGPKSSGARPMPDGRTQEPGGWNRIVLEVDDLPARIEELKKKGVKFRNELEVGPGGKQIQIEDPDGNPIEIFQPAAAE